MKKLLIMLLALLCLTAVAVAEGDQLYPAMDESGLYGYIDASGGWVIAPQFDDAYPFRGDYAVVEVLPKDLPEDALDGLDFEGLIDRTGQFVVEPHYFFDPGYDDGFYGGEHTGVWIVFSGYGAEARDGFFDIPTGTFAEPQWAWVAPWCTDSDLIAVAGGYASRSTGEMVIECEFGDHYHFHDGIALVAFLLDEETEEMSDYCLINEQGEIIPLPEGVQPDAYGEYIDGRVPVADESGMCGFADGEGNIAIPLEYADVCNFSEGYAAVIFPEGDWGYIDVNGNTLARGFTKAYDFYQGYGEIWTSGKNIYDSVTAWIDTSGAFVPFMDERFWPITHNRMWMDVEDANDAPNYLTDGEGNILSAEAVWLPVESAADFAGGLQPVKNAERRWGYMNLDGELVIPFTYDYTNDFDGELALVRLDGREGYIDRAGNEVYMWDDPIE